MPFQESHDLPEFRAWLITTLEPMCDADPAVMSDYIVALLKHDAVMSDEQWREFITRELADFLEEKSRSFVDLLFTTLQNKSFLPPPVVASAPAPAIVSSYRPSAPTGPAALRQEPIAGPSKLPQNGSSITNGRAIEQDVEMGAQPGVQQPGQQQAQPGGKRGKCYDYHERGFCMRGANCPYEHDADVIIPTPEMMFNNFQQPMPFPPQSGRGGRPPRGGRGGPVPNGGGMPPHMPFPFPGMPFMPFPPGGPPGPGGNGNGAGGGHARPPREHQFWGSNTPPADRTGSTLVITDIPAPFLSHSAIQNEFSKFGEVTNIAVDGPGKRALVSFATNREAFLAWKSDDAVFGSRHVKTLWHRPRPGQGGAGLQALEKSAGLVKNLNGQPVQPVKPKQSAAEVLAATLAELEKKERESKRETMIAEQKVLLKRAQEGSKEEKMTILTRLKALNKEMAELDKPLPASTDVLSNGEGGSDKEKLDKELQRLGMETTKSGDEEELLRLSAQLSALRDKANNLGINASTRYSPYSRGAPRGRGARARGRGRGGSSSFPPRPMRLDNRTRTIIVTGDALAGADANNVKEWYEGHGGNVIESEGGWTIGFPDRGMAEKVMAMGTKDLPGGIQANWHHPSIPATEGMGEVEMEDEGVRRGEADEDE
ncbi:hypothetical protein BCR39DRAFT_545231 [Naematelia encephala]|uniref:C3H1-type domain-containing protein n=1 Tax=Naematelia encephala TaxID=71784 RepID=A0A1Y2ARA4_9TREE|nr:hypothetical protein BCR39DRAFT_545231 [Naematelia encephala]